MPRPKLPEDSRRTAVLQVRLTPSEKQALEDGAKRIGVSIGALMREAALDVTRGKCAESGEFSWNLAAKHSA